jgi:hypothetical protein
MKHVHLALVALFTVGAVTACEKEAARPDQKIQPGLSIQLPRMPPKIGDQVLEAGSMDMEMVFDAKGQTIKARVKRESEELKKVLAVDGFSPSRLAITYKRSSEVGEMMGKTETEVDPRQGKTYIVFRENGQLGATYEDGSAPPSEELTEVLDDNDDVGMPDEMDAIIAGRTWKSGERYAFTAAELARINESKQRAEAGIDQDTERLTQIELMLRSAADGVAVFSLTMGIAIESDKGAFEFVLKGDASVDQTNGRLRDISGKGALSGKVNGMPLKGSVTMKMQSRWTTAP